MKKGSDFKQSQTPANLNLHTYWDSVRNFFKEFLHSKSEPITSEKISKLLVVHRLSIKDISEFYFKSAYHIS